MLTTPQSYGCWLSLNTGKASCEIPDRLMAIPIPPLIILFSVLHVRNIGYRVNLKIVACYRIKGLGHAYIHLLH